MEEECTDDSGCGECPLGKDFPIDCETQAIVVLVVLLLGCCCCYSCCIWCCCKARAVRSGRVVVWRQGGDSGKKEVPLNAKFEIFDDSEKALAIQPGGKHGDGGQDVEEGLGVTGRKKLVRWSYDAGIVDEWFASGDKDALAVGMGRMKIDELGDADAKDSAVKLEEGSTDKPKGGGDAEKATIRHVAILDAPVDDAPVALLAYGQNARVEYFSSTLSLWLSGYVIQAEAFTHTLNNSNASNKYNNGTTDVPDYNVKLSNGQLRYDVRLDELRLDLQLGETVEARVPPSKRWMQGIVKGRVSGNPTQHGYIIEIVGRDPPQTRASAANVRRHFPVGDKVDAYLGIDRGWASGVVVADPPVTDLLDADNVAEKFSLTPEWRKMRGSGKAQAWTTVAVKLLPNSDGDPDAASLAVPSFLLRRVAETGSAGAVPEPANTVGASSGDAMSVGAASPTGAQSPRVEIQEASGTAVA